MYNTSCIVAISGDERVGGPLFHFKFGSRCVRCRKIAATVKNLVESEIEKMNIDLIDVEYVKEGSRKIPEGIYRQKGRRTIDDCEMVAKQSPHDRRT